MEVEYHETTKDTLRRICENHQPAGPVRRRSRRVWPELACQGNCKRANFQELGQRLRRDGEPYNIGIGKFPLVNLSEARLKALKNARDNAAGRSLRGDAIPTFSQAVDAVIALHLSSWRGSKTESEWRQSLAIHAFPMIGGKPVDAISTADILAVLAPIWSGKTETARRVLQRISIVLRWAIAQGHRTDDPTHAATALLPRNGHSKPEHLAAMPHAEVADAIRKVRASGASAATLALEFLILTAARSGEARGGRCDEIDLEAREWRIPANRMKAGRPHRVPLSDRALAILCEAETLSRGDGLIFPSSRGGPIHGRTLGRALEAAGIEGVTVHGFRSSFRDWSGESGCASRGRGSSVGACRLRYRRRVFSKRSFRRAAGTYGSVGALYYRVVNGNCRFSP